MQFKLVALMLIPTGGPGIPATVSRGIVNVSALLIVQVLDLLDVMGMRQYAEKFKLEQVNGDILAECG